MNFQRYSKGVENLDADQTSLSSAYWTSTITLAKDLTCIASSIDGLKLTDLVYQVYL